MGHPRSTELPPVAPLLRLTFAGPLILNGGYDAATGTRAIDEGQTDLIAFGVPFLANPDLVERFRIGAPLNTPDESTFYWGARRVIPTIRNLPRPALPARERHPQRFGALNIPNARQEQQSK